MESEKELYVKIRQYISKIWYVGEDPDLQALREFKTETDMINLLSNLQTVEQEENKWLFKFVNILSLSIILILYLKY